jgi:hypothetical protein
VGLAHLIRRSARSSPGAAVWMLAWQSRIQPAELRVLISTAIIAAFVWLVHTNSGRAAKTSYLAWSDDYAARNLPSSCAMPTADKAFLVVSRSAPLPVRPSELSRRPRRSPGNAQHWHFDYSGLQRRCHPAPRGGGSSADTPRRRTKFCRRLIKSPRPRGARIAIIEDEPRSLACETGSAASMAGVGSPSCAGLESLPGSSTAGP